MPFISFCCLIADARTSNTMLNHSGDSGYPYSVPDLQGKAFSFSPLRMVLAVDFSYMAFMMFRYVPSILTFFRVFIKKGCYVLSNAFTASIDRIIWFFDFINVMYTLVCKY